MGSSTVDGIQQSRQVFSSKTTIDRFNVSITDTRGSRISKSIHSIDSSCVIRHKLRDKTIYIVSKLIVTHCEIISVYIMIRIHQYTPNDN